ncbi:MAG: YhdP family protein [Burkholderiales bacterium]
MAPTLALRLLRFAWTAIVAMVVVFLSLLLVIRYVAFPAIDDYRSRIASGLERQLGLPVTIDSIVGGWDGWNPRLSINGFAIRDRAQPAGKPVLLLPRVDLVVAWTSLVAFDLRLKELSIERPELSVRRDAQGRLHVGGFEIDPESPADDTRFTDWLLRQRQIVVHDALLIWNDELRNAPQLVLDHVMFRLERTFGSHRFGLVGSFPNELAAPVDLRGEVFAISGKDWRDMKASFYARLDYADVAAWREWFPVLRPVENGEGAVRVWFDVAGGKATNVVADLELTNVRVRIARGLPLLDLTHLGGRMTWKADGARRTLSTRGLTFRTSGGAELQPVALTAIVDEDAEGAVSGGQVAFDRLEVAPLSVLAGHLPLPQRWRQDLTALALRGSVSNGKFAWSGPPDAPTKYSGSGAFTKFGIAASAALPGAASVSGNFTFDEARGDLKLDSRDMRVTLPRVFAEPLTFDVASGQVGWARGDDGLRISIDNLRFATPHTSGTASGAWHSNAQGPGTLDLKAQLARGEAQHLYRYLPLTLDPHVRDWLRLAIKQGTATDIRMALAGDLADFPFADPRRGQFLVTFKASDVTLDYAAGWPEVSGADADVKFEGTGLYIDAKRGRILGASVGPLKMDIPHLGVAHPVLTIAGEAVGTSAEFLQFIEKSPVGGWIGHVTDGVQASGNGRLDLKFSLPLGKGDGVKVAGDYQFINNQLRVPGAPGLVQVNGHLVFTERSMQSRDLSAEALGGPIRIAVGSEDDVVRLNASGTSSVAALRAEFDVPLMHRMSGIADWQFTSLSRAEGATWTIESNLKGAAIDLPAPAGKDAGEAVALKVERRPVPGKPNEDTLTVDYRGEARAIAHRTLTRDTSTIDRALVLLGTAVPRGGVADRPGLWVRGRLTDFDLDEWMALWAKEFPRPAAAADARPAHSLELNGVDIEVGRLDVFARVLHDLHATAQRADGEWRMKLSGREVDGMAVWRGPGPGMPNGRVMARLARFVAPGPDELHPARSEITTGEKAQNTWPELDIAADSFVSRTGHDLGKFELLAQPTGPDWRITRMSLVNPAGRIDASGWWRVGREKPTTDIDVTLTAEDAGEFLERFGYPVAVRNAPTTIAGNLMWNGAPNDFDFPSLGGSFKLTTGAGQFTKIDPGIGKLLGVLSLQALPRRITLDFRDVFSEGFAFDDISGEFKIQQGLMRTQNLTLEGPAATVAITGDIDLARETQKLDVRVKPALSTTFSAGAAVLFLANPIIGAAVGAGTLLAQKLMDNPLGKLFSYDYRVSGSWSDPQVERVGLPPLPSAAAAAGGGAVK